MTEIIWAVALGLLIFGWLFALLLGREMAILVMICLTVAIIFGGLIYWGMTMEPLLPAKELMGE